MARNRIEKKNAHLKEPLSKAPSPAGAEVSGKGSARPAKSFGRRLKVFLIILLCAVALLAAGMAYGGYRVTVSELNFPRVYADGISVGRLNGEDTRSMLEQHQWDESAELALRVKLPAGVSFKLDPCRAGAMLTLDGVVDAAHRYGRTGNWFENFFAYIKNFLIPVDITEASTRLDEAYIKSCVQSGIEKFNSRFADSGYTVDSRRDVLQLIKGAGQVRLDEQALYTGVCSALLDGSRLYEFYTLSGSVTAPDFAAIQKELSVEPENARFAEDSLEIIPEVIGCDFDLEQAVSLWNAAEVISVVEIPLTVSVPEITEEYLRSLLFRDKLGSQTTYYTWSTSNRINNINKAAASINGIVLMPGQEFSYNSTVGQRTTDAGYLPAGAYNDGQVVQEVGGGICQVSSTLYCAAMFAQLETVERTSHYFPVDYLDWGLDATVSWPGPDYKFRNSRDYPVKIVATCDNDAKTITIEIWGTDVDGSYVELRHVIGAVYDDEYPDVVIGYGASLSRYGYDKDGNQIYVVTEPYSFYNLHEEDIKWPDPVPSPDVTPDIGIDDPGIVIPTEPEPSTEPDPGTDPEPDYGGEGVVIPPA